jgi:hypothetical protein
MPKLALARILFVMVWACGAWTPRWASATTYSEYTYAGNGFNVPLTCTGPGCDPLGYPFAARLGGTVDLAFDTTGLSGTFTVLGAIYDNSLGYPSHLSTSGTVTLTDGYITDWSISGGSVFGHVIELFSTSTTTDSDIVRASFDTQTGPESFYGTASGPSGEWSAPYVWTDQSGTTPIPSSLPLFASALGGFSMLGWARRKRSGFVAYGAALTST